MSALMEAWREEMDAGEARIEAIETRETNSAERAEGECEALRHGNPRTVTLSTGQTLTVSEPKALAWMKALARLQKAIKPIAMLVMAAVEAPELLETEEGRLAVFQNILGRLGSEADIEATLEALMTACDALLGRDEGWCADQTPPDLMAVVAALLQVIEPGRYRYFFGQVVVNMKAVMATAGSAPRA